MPTFTYTFPDQPGDSITVTTGPVQAVNPGFGDPDFTGYPITAISGTFNGEPIQGLLGSGGQYGYDGYPPNGGPTGQGGDNAGAFDNTIFTGDDQGDSPNPDPTTGGGSSFGIDDYGIGFYTDTAHYALSYGATPGGGFGIESGGVGPTPIRVTSADAPCYVTGTLIRTSRGDVAVETLSVGDLAVTASGERRPIRWIGHRTLACAHHSDPALVQPVRIRANAIGANKPVRDLVVSPGHSIALDVLGEVLIPAGVLVNGATIVQEAVESVTYWHVELDSHDLLVAEGLAAESYLDMGNRSFFAHCSADAAVVDLTAGSDADPASRTQADFCRPFHDHGPVVEAVKMQIQRRAEMMGSTLAVPALTLAAA